MVIVWFYRIVFLCTIWRLSSRLVELRNTLLSRFVVDYGQSNVRFWRLFPFSFLFRVKTKIWSLSLYLYKLKVCLPIAKFQGNRAARLQSWIKLFLFYGRWIFAGTTCWTHLKYHLSYDKKTSHFNYCNKQSRWNWII